MGVETNHEPEIMGHHEIEHRVSKWYTEMKLYTPQRLAFIYCVFEIVCDSVSVGTSSLLSSGISPAIVGAASFGTGGPVKFLRP